MHDSYIKLYEDAVQAMWQMGRGDGGPIRSLKGKMVEALAEEMVQQAWRNLGGDPTRITISKNKYPIEDDEGNIYRLSQDKHIYIDGEFVLSIECKAYAEVAMFKRILVDCYLLKKQFPKLKFCLLQLESMLRGDYSTDIKHAGGSSSVKVLEHHFPDLDIEIITLLEGERHVKKEIHKKEFYKPLVEDRLQHAMDYFEKVLAPYD